MAAHAKWFGRLVLLPILVMVAVPLRAADPPQWFETETKEIEVKARLVRDTAEIKQLLGDDLQNEFILVELDIRPLPGAKFELKRDHFLMRTYRNNDTSPAQSPDRIAGESELVLGKGETVTVGIFSTPTPGIPVGGAPGTNTRPRRIGGEDNIGGGGVKTAENPEVSQGHREDGADVLSRLQSNELPTGTIDDVIHGYLYFQLNPREKPKNLTLNYHGPAGEFQILFQKKQ